MSDAFPQISKHYIRDGVTINEANGVSIFILSHI